MILSWVVEFEFNLDEKLLKCFSIDFVVDDNDDDDVDENLKIH